MRNGGFNDPTRTVINYKLEGLFSRGSGEELILTYPGPDNPEAEATNELDDRGRPRPDRLTSLVIGEWVHGDYELRQSEMEK